MDLSQRSIDKQLRESFSVGQELLLLNVEFLEFLSHLIPITYFHNTIIPSQLIDLFIFWQWFLQFPMIFRWRWRMNGEWLDGVVDWFLSPSLRHLCWVFPRQEVLRSDRKEISNEIHVFFPHSQCFYEIRSCLFQILRWNLETPFPSLLLPLLLHSIPPLSVSFADRLSPEDRSHSMSLQFLR